VVDGRNERNSSTTDAVWWNKITSRYLVLTSKQQLARAKLGLI